MNWSLLFKNIDYKHFLYDCRLKYLFIVATLFCIMVFLTSVRYLRSNTPTKTLSFSRNSFDNHFNHSNSRRIIADGINIEKEVTNPGLQNRLPVVKFKASFVANSRDILVGSSRTGRLGNHLFQFASGYGIARLLNRTFVIGMADPILKLFIITDVILTDRVSQIRKWQRVRSKQCCAFDETVLQRADRKKGNIMVGYSLQSWKYFAHVVNEIRAQLRFQPYIQEKANDIMHEIFLKYSCPSCIFRNESPVFIGVHIRRGDIVNQEKLQEFGYLTAPIGYIYRAMNYYIQHFKNIIFVVCSNTMVWTKNVFQNSSNINVEFVHGPPEVDLAVLSSCNHSIITVGTFGWWAGFLAGGQVIHYKYQAREGTKLRKGFSQSMDDYFLPHWISMSWSLCLKKSHLCRHCVLCTMSMCFAFINDIMVFFW